MPKSKKQHTSKKHNVIKESFDTDNESFIDDGNISETSLDHLILRNEEPVFDTKFININDDGVLNGPKTNKELGNGKKIPLNRIVKNNVHVTQTHDNDSNLFRECAINSKTPNASEALDEKYAMLQKSLSQDTKENFKNYNKEDIEQTNIAPQENTNKYSINNNDNTNTYVDNEVSNINKNNDQKQLMNSSMHKEQQTMNASITNDQKLSMSDYDISNINNINHNKNVNKEAFSIINKDNDIVEINAAYTGPYKLNKAMFRKCYIIIIILILISILLLAFFVNYKKYIVKKNEEKDNDINNSNNKLVKDISRENNNILHSLNKQSAFSGGDTNINDNANTNSINNNNYVYNINDNTNINNINDINNNSDQLINDLFNSSNNDNNISDDNYVHKLNVTNHSNTINEKPKLNIKNNNRSRDKHGRFIKIK